MRVPCATARCEAPPTKAGHIEQAKMRPEGFEPPPTQIRSLRLYPLSYGRIPRKQYETSYLQYTTA